MICRWKAGGEWGTSQSPFPAGERLDRLQQQRHNYTNYLQQCRACMQPGLRAGPCMCTTAAVLCHGSENGPSMSSTSASTVTSKILTWFMLPGSIIAIKLHSVYQQFSNCICTWATRLVQLQVFAAVLPAHRMTNSKVSTSHVLGGRVSACPHTAPSHGYISSATCSSCLAQQASQHSYSPAQTLPRSMEPMLSSCHFSRPFSCS